LNKLSPASIFFGAVYSGSTAVN